MVANYSLKNNFRNKAYNVQYILDSSEIFIYYFDSCQLIYAYKLHFHLHGKKEICRHLQTVQKKAVSYGHLEFQNTFMGKLCSDFKFW